MSIEALRRAYEQRTEPAKAAGKPVVAYLGNAVPVELIVAAGCFPMQMSGDPAQDVPLAEHYLDDDFDGDLCSVYQRIVSGYYNFADLIVLPRSSNGYLYLYYFLLETRRLRDQPFPEVVLFDVLHTPYWSTGQYVYQRVLDLKAKLEQLSGHAIGDEALRAAIVTVNRTRTALQAVNALRRQEPPRLSGSDVLRAIGAAQFIGPASAEELCLALLAQADSLPALQGVRVMVKGAPHDNAGFYELVESLGAVIVADDHTAGERTIERLADESIEPLAALAQHYHLHTPSIRSFPQAAQDQRFIDIVEAAKVQAVIFFHDEFDDTLGWDYPEQKRLLDQRGIASVFLQQQSYRAPDRAAQRAAIEDLLARSRA
jgi:benzoyl-CoA reductase/2-hydroxyglutaryl-CoA dehydratase subunit BcrC/BadD/HgdB